jgi:hypothetical protein
MVALAFAFTSAAERGWSGPVVIGAFTVADLSGITLVLSVQPPASTRACSNSAAAWAWPS